MKLSADHFQHLENSIDDVVRDAQATALMSLSGFGLIPYSVFSVQNAQGTSPQSVRVILNACRAILPGGYRVEIVPENVQKLQIPTSAPFVEFVPNPGLRYHLYLSIDEERKSPAGKAETRPIRYPHLTPDYHLECVQQDKMSAVQNLAPNRMKIAEWQDGKVIDGYIPPCLITKGFPLLEKWYQFLQNQLENIVRISIHVINEHRKKDRARADFCAPIVQWIRGSQTQFKWIIPGQSPIFLVAYFGDLAGLIDGLLETSDRDFVRNQLKNGEINNIRLTIHEVLKPTMIHLDEIAISISSIQRFTVALIGTLQNLITTQAPAPRMGDRKIASG